jgi:long-subunit acyl-CoA synthetase (AMP-forming)
LPQASPLFDKIVFKKVKQRLGGNVKLLVSGGAPLAPHVEDFLKVAMCAPVVQVRVRRWGAAGGGAGGGVQPFAQVRIQGIGRYLRAYWVYGWGPFVFCGACEGL